MPGGDGTGPTGQGPVGPGGLGRGRGRNFSGLGSRAAGRGPGGYCICRSCGQKIRHNPGKPCAELKCPNCGQQMVRG
jgi:hypothetical protein